MSESIPLDVYAEMSVSRNERVRSYFSDMSQGEIEVTHAIAEGFHKPDLPLADTVVLIPVAAHQESSRIISTLSEYAQQSTDRPFTVLLHLNAPHDEASNPEVAETQKQIEYAKRLYPHLDVRSSLVFMDDATIGEIRRDLWNSALMLAHFEGKFDEPGKDVIGINNDIDAVYISPRYIQAIQDHYDRRQKKYDRINLPDTPQPPMGTRLKHAFPHQLPNIGKVISWVDASYAQVRKHHCYEGGMVVPLSWYAAAGGFDPRAKTHETASLTLGREVPVIQNAYLETSPRRYIDRLGEHGIRGIWAADTFGTSDSCRQPGRRQDVTHEKAEDIILQTLSDDIEHLWLRPVRDVVTDQLLNVLVPTAESLDDTVIAEMEKTAQRQLAIVDRMLGGIVGSSILAELVKENYPAKETVRRIVDDYRLIFALENDGDAFEVRLLAEDGLTPPDATSIEPESITSLHKKTSV